MMVTCVSLSRTAENEQYHHHHHHREEEEREYSVVPVEFTTMHKRVRFADDSTSSSSSSKSTMLSKAYQQDLKCKKQQTQDEEEASFAGTSAWFAWHQAHHRGDLTNIIRRQDHINDQQQSPSWLSSPSLHKTAMTLIGSRKAQWICVTTIALWMLMLWSHYMVILDELGHLQRRYSVLLGTRGSTLVVTLDDTLNQSHLASHVTERKILEQSFMITSITSRHDEGEAAPESSDEESSAPTLRGSL